MSFNQIYVYSPHKGREQVCVCKCMCVCQRSRWSSSHTCRSSTHLHSIYNNYNQLILACRAHYCAVLCCVTWNVVVFTPFQSVEAAESSVCWCQFELDISLRLWITAVKPVRFTENRLNKTFCQWLAILSLGYIWVFFPVFIWHNFCQALTSLSAACQLCFQFWPSESVKSDRKMCQFGIKCVFLTVS